MYHSPTKNILIQCVSSARNNVRRREITYHPLSWKWKSVPSYTYIQNKSTAIRPLSLHIFNDDDVDVTNDEIRKSKSSTTLVFTNARTSNYSTISPPIHFRSSSPRHVRHSWNIRKRWPFEKRQSINLAAVIVQVILRHRSQSTLLKIFVCNTALCWWKETFLTYHCTQWEKERDDILRQGSLEYV